jgi:excisionase family DNA binding protein
VLNSVEGSGTAPATLPGRAAKPNPSGMLSNGGIGKRLLTVVEAAGYLGLQVDTVYKKARLRELPSVKVGRALRFDVKALERFVEQHTIETID